MQHPGYSTAYNTLGVVYQHQREYAMADRTLKYALAREPNNLIVMRNLAPVLAAMGKQAESAALARRLASIDPSPPFHFFNLGKTALEQARYQDARELFEREVRRAPYNDEFHFWLGVSHLRLGDPRRAAEHFATALKNSTTGDATRLYSNKIDYLRSLN